MKKLAPHPLHALSPIDGRYAEQSAPLQAFFSESALMKYRVLVEIRWLQTLSRCKDIAEVPAISPQAHQQLEKIIHEFSIEHAIVIKEIEQETNHDIKAIEYFLKKAFAQSPELHALFEFIHFACTSEDINNLAYGLMIKEARDNVLLPSIAAIETQLQDLIAQHAHQPMLSRTHGQAATPTTVGKEFANTLHRLEHQREQLATQRILGKCNGAVGNFNAHIVAYPNVNWLELSKQFVHSLGLSWNAYTTQIEPHDALAELAHVLIRLNTILLDFSRDTWSTISLGYFKQKMVATEVGSSTMPHKINPIHFENAEGNLGFANAMLEHFAAKLPISRWQRDLSDSTVLRNIGVAFSHCLIAYTSLSKGLTKIDIDREAIENDLKDRWELLAEPVQTVMRRYNIAEPYERLKALTRGRTITRESLDQFIEELELPGPVKKELLALSPLTYIGLAGHLATLKTKGKPL